jgi:hypothetical protein
VKLLLTPPTVIEDSVLAGQEKSFAGAAEISYDYAERNPV